MTSLEVRRALVRMWWARTRMRWEDWRRQTFFCPRGRHRFIIDLRPFVGRRAHFDDIVKSPQVCRDCHFTLEVS